MGAAKKKHQVRTLLIALLAVVIVLISLSILGYIFNWDWTGLGRYISPPHPKDTDFQRGKTLWDWLQLLIIPAVLAITGYVINLTISEGEQEATKQGDKTEREIAEENQREAALQAYIDKMSELLLEKKLRESTVDGEVRKIARVHTLTVLPRLDAKRKASVLLFLYESSLINNDKCIIYLSGANLSEADLSGSDLSGANLSEANLIGAIMSGATLIGANLNKADLSKANLQQNLEEAIRTSSKRYPYLHSTILIGANLSGANLSGTYLTGVHMSGSNLSGTNLSGAILIDANFGKTMREDNVKKIEADTVLKYWPDSGGISLEYLSTISGTSGMTELNVRFESGANLNKANLSGADLRRANLSDTDLIGSVLHEADLSEANLSGALITDEQLKQAKSLKGATMPDGSKHP